jgi:hypothetical protein
MFREVAATVIKDVQREFARAPNYQDICTRDALLHLVPAMRPMRANGYPFDGVVDRLTSDGVDVTEYPRGASSRRRPPTRRACAIRPLPSCRSRCPAASGPTRRAPRRACGQDAL